MHSKAAACRPTCLAALSPIAQARCACCEGCSSLAAGWRCSTCSRSRGQTSEQRLREGEGQGQAGEGQASLQQAVPSPTCRFATAAAKLTAENPPLSGYMRTVPSSCAQPALAAAGSTSRTMAAACNMWAALPQRR